MALSIVFHPLIHGFFVVTIVCILHGEHLQAVSAWILVNHVVHKHCIFKGFNLHIEMILEHGNVKLGVVEHHSLLIKEFLKFYFYIIVNNVCINISPRIRSRAKRDTENMPIARIEASRFRIDSNEVVRRINTSLNIGESICFFCDSDKLFIINLCFLFCSCNIPKNICLGIVPCFLCFRLKRKHCRINCRKKLLVYNCTGILHYLSNLCIKL